MTDFSRRTLFAAAAALPAYGALSSMLPAPAFASLSQSGQQVPSLYRYKVGDLEVTAVSDGARVSPLAEGFVKNASLADVNAALKAAFLPEGQIVSQFNPLLVNTGEKLILIDTGNGPQAGTASVGKLMQNLSWAGVKPIDIDTIIITHFHADHINGLRDDDGGLAFPNAEVMVPAAEWAFWMDDGQMSRAPEGQQAGFKNVRRVFKDIETKVNRFEADKEIAPGITSMATYGHTPGHTSLVVASGKEKLLVQGDVTNLPALFVTHPEWQVQYDMDPAKATETRRKVYDMLAAERMAVTGYHFPFPALGFVAKDGDGYRLVPAAWNPVL
ncbi:MBL fold metallo-hydrolase [Ancylobacter sp. 6x-1]|uniref:MBL fold metallo-hydrolase n=1 Tax=Ancylobacter crimeensis TaxID=2579147 RepID=A0ABT0DFE1_9HYPH|nr:MBL fold metallo-hydrolase [Ancylobacter crimeensis]MCK0198594.1 MBL fold metallo-hydrolase [Ancylobacter crimeensis]